MKKLMAVILVMTLCLSLAACKKNNVAESASPSPSSVATPTPSATPVPVKPVVAGVPHDGIRPVAVVIDNQGEESFPQAGLSQAQIVYEFLVEGGITRYIGLFWESEMDLVGPVRSARDYMLDIIMPYDAIFVHNGGSPSALNEIDYEKKVDSFDGTKSANKIFEDITDNPNNWQDTFTTSEKINAYIGETEVATTTALKGYPNYSSQDITLEQGTDAKIINISYSTVSFCTYMYDAEKKLYFRNRNGETHVDRNTNEPISTTNIIVQKVKSEVIEGDDAGRLSVELIGAGEGYYCTLGKCIQITWAKADEESPTVYKDMNGNEIDLNEGSTWIQIVPMSIDLLIL
ncbi:MAG: DUF3048 domain-containing protein [Clostridia bacterium]|nr:DUF3048 domain-containing protein [Clostridia bacterium]